MVVNWCWLRHQARCSRSQKITELTLTDYLTCAGKSVSAESGHTGTVVATRMVRAGRIPTAVCVVYITLVNIYTET